MHHVFSAFRSGKRVLVGSSKIEVTGACIFKKGGFEAGKQNRLITSVLFTK